jgi:hypothetical protein
MTDTTFPLISEFIREAKGKVECCRQKEHLLESTHPGRERTDSLQVLWCLVWMDHME